MSKDLDVVIAGGGPAGAAAALSLTSNGLSAAIVEQSEYQSLRVGESLPPAIKVPLTQLGVWGDFIAAGHAHSPVVRSVWGTDAPYELDHIYNPYGEGWHVDRRAFDAMLAQAAHKAGAVVMQGVSIISCERAGSGKWAIEVGRDHTRERLFARFLIDATGRSSDVARRFGARRVLHDRLVGVVGFFGPGPDASVSGAFILVESVADGWWYSVALPDSRLVAAYMTDADLFARGHKPPADHWREKLEQTVHTKARLSGWTAEGKLKVAPANSSRLDWMKGEGWLAIGDAAAAFDPLSGQGVYLALKSGMLAAQEVRDSLDGDSALCSAYVPTMERFFSNFLDLRAKYYGTETRWRDSPFWRRRRIAPGRTGQEGYGNGD